MFIAICLARSIAGDWSGGEDEARASLAAHLREVGAVLDERSRVFKLQEVDNGVEKAVSQIPRQ